MKSCNYKHRAALGLMLVGLATWAGAAIEQPDNFAECVAGLKQRALQENISSEVVASQLDLVQFVPRVIELDRRQPEFTETFHNYLTKRVSDYRISKGRQLLREHYDLLLQLTKKYGIPPQYLVAFWGLETNFGSYLGKMNVLDSLTTLACDERRSEFFSGELMQALRLVETGVADHSSMLGSWAGAMGNMQFMPSAYLRYAVDGDGDGKADLWNSLPDAFTSAANFLNSLGWEPNLRWGREVILPTDFDFALAGRDMRKPLRDWRQLGLTDVQGNRLPALDLMASVIVPSGANGPAFVVYQNFNVIMGWNRSEYYALAVGRLADRINGGGGLRVMPPDDERLTIDTVQWVQSALNQLGYDAGPADGILGTRTKRALRDLQQEKGWVADGYLSDAMLVQLQRLLPQAAEKPAQSMPEAPGS
jgi:membrane-bound lytic murein transglycosylase B